MNSYILLHTMQKTIFVRTQRAVNAEKKVNAKLRIKKIPKSRTLQIFFELKITAKATARKFFGSNKTLKRI